MAKHGVPRGENGTMTSQTGRKINYQGRHRDGEGAKGSSAQQKTSQSDLPHRDGRRGR